MYDVGMSDIDLAELFKLLDAHPFPVRGETEAYEDDDGWVHIVDKDTRAPRMSMLREDYDALRAWKP